MEIDSGVVVTAAQVESLVQPPSNDSAAMQDAPELPDFAPLSALEMDGGKVQYRLVPVPPHRFSPLKRHWMELYTPIVKHMNLQVRMNQKRRAVEIRTSEFTENAGAIQKAADFLRAFMLGFEIRDAIALLRLDDLYIDSFEIKDVKDLKGEHLSRAIGRVAGQGGKTKFTIENATKTRIVLADSHIHILGSFSNIKTARSALVRLLRGSPPGKVYSQMRAVAGRNKDRF